MLDYFVNPDTWTTLLTIVGIDIILSGDNAVVIALACRGLPSRQQKFGVACGAAIAVILRVVFTVFIAFLLTVPFLKLIGGGLLFWVGYKLMTDNADGEQVESAGNVWHAVRIIVVADAVMSLDNVIAVAAAAKGDNVMLILGLLISIPLVVYGSTLLIKLIERFPVIVPGGAALIGFIGGEVAVSDPALASWIATHAVGLHHIVPPLGTVLVIVVSRLAVRPLATDPVVVAEEAAVGKALFLGRAVLTRCAALAVVAAAYLVGDAEAIAGEGALMQIVHGLRPIFAAVIAILIGDAVVAIVARVGKSSQIKAR